MKKRSLTSSLSLAYPSRSTLRAALLRVLAARPAVGSGFLFPAPCTPGKAVDRRLVSRWLREAEKAAGIEHVKGLGFHGLRRRWATLRKGMADIEVATGGGWKSIATLKLYQQADPASVLAVVLAKAQ
ncbi:MAG: tyrosine-type recombinase/integrase [bacterium]